MAALRAAAAPVPMADLVTAAPDAQLRDREQRDRCLDALVADGLVEPVAGGHFTLPGLGAGADRPARL
jgi:A/G-specific adenine glycosylase